MQNQEPLAYDPTPKIKKYQMPALSQVSGNGPSILPEELLVHPVPTPTTTRVGKNLRNQRSGTKTHRKWEGCPQSQLAAPTHPQQLPELEWAGKWVCPQRPIPQGHPNSWHLMGLSGSCSWLSPKGGARVTARPSTFRKAKQTYNGIQDSLLTPSARNLVNPASHDRGLSFRPGTQAPKKDCQTYVWRRGC